MDTRYTTRATREDQPADRVIQKKTKPNQRATVSVDDKTTTCPLFLGAHVSDQYLSKIKDLVEASDKAYFRDPTGYGARPLESTVRAFETPMGAKLAGAAEHLAQSGTLNSDVGQAFIDRLPYSVKANVRAGIL